MTVARDGKNPSPGSQYFFGEVLVVVMLGEQVDSPQNNIKNKLNDLNIVCPTKLQSVF